MILDTEEEQEEEEEEEEGGEEGVAASEEPLEEAEDKSSSEQNSLSSLFEHFTARCVDYGFTSVPRMKPWLHFMWPH